MASGVYIWYVEKLNEAKFEELSYLTPSFFVRAAMLLFFVVYIILIREKKALMTAVPVALCWTASLFCGYFIFDALDVFKDARYIANFVSNLAVLFVYARVFEPISAPELRERISGIICLTMIVYSAAIVIPYIFGIGFSTYTDRFGFRGARGFFYSGNDITAALMLMLPISCSAFMKDTAKVSSSRGIAGILAPALAVNSLCLIGTKTAFIAIAATFLFLGIYSLAKLREDSALVKKLGLIVFGIAAVFALLAVVSGGEVVEMIKNSLLMPASIAEREDASTAIFSGRLAKMMAALRTWRDGGFLVWLFGTGRVMHVKNIEMDVMEVLCYYGVLGGAFMLWPYLRLGCGFVADFVKKAKKHGIELVHLVCFLALVLGVSYLFIAGHVLFSATSGFYFSLVLIYSVITVKSGG